MEETTTSAQSKKTIGLVVLLIAVAVVSGYLGYWFGTQNVPGPVQTPAYVGLETAGLKLGPESIIKSQQATATGKVGKVDTAGITIQGDDGKIGVFRFAQEVQIYPQSSSASAAATPSKNPADIKVGEMVILSMTLEGTGYVVNSVSYLPK